MKAITIHTEKGNILKKYPFHFLTKHPEKALEILNTCKDNEEYCVMEIIYYFYHNIKYVQYGYGEIINWVSTNHNKN